LIGFESELDSRTKSAYSKMATYFGRFILLFHVLDSVYVYPFQSLKFCEVKVHSVEKAIKLLKYFMHQYDLVSNESASKREADNILAETKGMSNKEKAILLKQKDPTLSDRKIAKILNVSNVTVSKYFK
jgi:DNA-directed RNA polymerase specialized sigma subunit